MFNPSAFPGIASQSAIKSAIAMPPTIRKSKPKSAVTILRKVATGSQIV